jgi:hypothetical protein
LYQALGLCDQILVLQPLLSDSLFYFILLFYGIVEIDGFDTNVVVFFFFFYFQGTYLHHKEIKAAQGIKITGQVIVIC